MKYFLICFFILIVIIFCTYPQKYDKLKHDKSIYDKSEQNVNQVIDHTNITNIKKSKLYLDNIDVFYNEDELPYLFLTESFLKSIIDLFKNVSEPKIFTQYFGMGNMLLVKKIDANSKISLFYLPHMRLHEKQLNDDAIRFTTDI